MLDPFLFLVYINDIVNDINNDIRLFADDTSLFVVVENDHTAAATSLTDDLNVISNWAKKMGNSIYSSKNKKFRPLRDKRKINILYLVLSQKFFLNETKNHNLPPIQVKWSVP